MAEQEVKTYAWNSAPCINEKHCADISIETVNKAGLNCDLIVDEIYPVLMTVGLGLIYLKNK